MSAGRIHTGNEVTGDLALSCDVCVVGSGAGGAWLAHELVAAGRSVILLEEGGYHTRREFNLTEQYAYANLYQELGNRTTDDLAITVLQGRSVGGGTTVNWCSSFRTPRRILEHWRAVHGVEGLTEEALTPHWEAVERRLHIAQWPEERMNRNNRLLWDGLGKLGYQRGLIRRNVNNCANLGHCGHGCPIDAKQSMSVTVLPDAVEKGLVLYADTSVRRLETSGRKVTRVLAEVLDPATGRPTGRRIVVQPKVAVVSGGAINSPALLLRSGLDGGGQVGKRTFLHPVVGMAGLFDEEVAAFNGAPQAVYSHQFEDRGPGKLGYFLEVPPIHPMFAATSFGGMGAAHQELLTQLPFVSAVLGICIDGLLETEEGGTVTLRDQGYSRPKLHYPLTALHFEAFRSAAREMARVLFAAGARRVISTHSVAVELRSPADLPVLDAAPWEPLKVKVGTAHQLGGCAMGKDPSRSVVDSCLRYHGMDNLFVVDGSVLPTSLGVNPQETIFGLARWAAQHVQAAV